MHRPKQQKKTTNRIVSIILSVRSGTSHLTFTSCTLSRSRAYNMSRAAFCRKNTLARSRKQHTQLIGLLKLVSHACKTMWRACVRVGVPRVRAQGWARMSSETGKAVYERIGFADNLAQSNKVGAPAWQSADMVHVSDTQERIEDNPPPLNSLPGSVGKTRVSGSKSPCRLSAVSGLPASSSSRHKQ